MNLRIGYCETNLLSETAWQLFGGMAPH